MVIAVPKINRAQFDLIAFSMNFTVSALIGNSPTKSVKFSATETSRSIDCTANGSAMPLLFANSSRGLATIRVKMGHFSLEKQAKDLSRQH